MVDEHHENRSQIVNQTLTEARKTSSLQIILLEVKLTERVRGEQMTAVKLMQADLR